MKDHRIQTKTTLAYLHRIVVLVKRIGKILVGLHILQISPRTGVARVDAAAHRILVPYGASASPRILGVFDNKLHVVSEVDRYISKSVR